jgi:hypothetical protein
VGHTDEAHGYSRRPSSPFVSSPGVIGLPVSEYSDFHYRPHPGPRGFVSAHVLETSPANVADRDVTICDNGIDGEMGIRPMGINGRFGESRSSSSGCGYPW